MHAAIHDSDSPCSNPAPFGTTTPIAQELLALCQLSVLPLPGWALPDAGGGAINASDIRKTASSMEYFGSPQVVPSGFNPPSPIPARTRAGSRVTTHCLAQLLRR